MLTMLETSSSLVTGVTGIFDVLAAGADFIINDIFINLIINQVFTQPIVWVGAAVGIGISLLNRFKKPLR